MGAAQNDINFFVAREGTLISAKGILIPLLALTLGGCGSIKDKVAYDANAIPISSVRINLLKCACSDETVPIAARNAMVAEFFKRAEVRIVSEGEADVVIDGTITHSEGSVSKGTVSAFSAGSGSTSGRFVSGITLMANRGGSLIATGGYTAPIKAGLQPSTEGMATTAAMSIMRPLFANGLKPKAAK